MDNSGASALVTAAAKRVGRVLALRLAQKGYDIALHYHNSEAEAEKTAEEIRKLGRLCRLFKADLCRNQETEGLILKVLEKMPKLSVLVNNASIWQPCSFLESDLADLKKYQSLHLEAPYILIRDFAKNQKSGLVVNILDSNIVRQNTEYFPYLLSKKALWDLTLMAAGELAPKFRVNAIAPGAVLPPEDERQEKYSKKFNKNPLQREGSPEDIADALEFFLKAEHVTGQCLFVSAGKQLL
ncbi:MAG: SDR family oxidoreductase [Candidatus Obscuribacterales bacterium]|nr:SDR family oxidoreductase [Candidatus Obscuribacterales bacterium]